jgi:tight adherence protein C
VVPVTASLGWAALCGVALGIGLWALLGTVPRLAPPRLAARMAPYLADVSAEARRIVSRRTADPLPVLGLLGGPVIAAARNGLDRLLGGRATILRRIRAAGLTQSVERYRTRQLGFLVGGATAGVLLAVALAPTTALPPAALIVLPGAAAAGSLALPDWLLARRASRRLARIREELPTVLEFLLLALSAGEGIREALRRVSRVGSGELSGELAALMAEVQAGVPLGTALSRLGRELPLPPLVRALEHLAAALERGAPLVDVLRAQVEDCRRESKQNLLELAGRREVLMLVPLVFLILPTTVAIAIFPGLLVLQTGF